MLRRFIIPSFITALCIFGASAQTSQVRKTHSKIHEQHLANLQKSRMDPSVISDFLKEDIVKREINEEKVSVLSKASDQMLSDLLSEANRHIGKPYRHGMKGPKAFDCSGFSSYVYRQFGYSLSPSSRAQYTQGVKVDRKNLRKGDLVFFTSRSSGKNVGHVGIVVSANNSTGDFKFIHASIKGVKIDDCQGYYEGRYIGARRIVTE